MFPRQLLQVTFAFSLASIHLFGQKPQYFSKIQLAEDSWYNLTKDVEYTIQPAIRNHPENATWSCQINHSGSLSDLSDCIDIWIDKKSKMIHVRYRSPFLVGWLRQIALLQPDPKSAQLSESIKKIRMIDFTTNEVNHPNLHLRDLVNQLLKLRFHISDNNPLVGPVPVVDGCYLSINTVSETGFKYSSHIDDYAIDQWAEKLSMALKSTWILENIPSYNGFLSNECLERLGSDFLTRAAIYPDYFPLAEALIKLGVNPNATASSGERPLVEACQGNLPLVRMLLAKGADPQLGNFSELWPDFMPIDAAVNSVESGEPSGMEIVKLLLEHGASPNKFGSGYGSPLARARAKQNAPLVEMLMKAGANE